MQIQQAFDKVKSEIASKKVPGNLSENMNLVCEYLVKQQLKSMLPEIFQKSDPNKPPFVVLEDNEAVIKICFKGRSGALRHCHRTHRVAIEWLFETFKDISHQLRYVRTIYQIADIFTKAIVKPETWRTLLYLSQIRETERKLNTDVVLE